MKIGVSSSGSDILSFLDPRFGRCSYFIIYDTDNENVKVVENKGQTSSGGAGIAAAQQIIDEGVDILITGNLGPNAFNLFRSSGIKTYKSVNMKVKAVLQMFMEGKLEELNEAGPSHPGPGMGNGHMFRGGR